MKPFDYVRAADRAEAIATVAAEPGAMFLAGGTNLVDLMKLGVATPDRLVDVTRLLPAEIEPRPDGGVRIGAGVRNSDLAVHRTIRRDFPLVSRALLAGASGQLRNVATVGGNLVQRTRCGYFTDTTKPCNKRTPGSGCPARTGHHRDLAVLGGSASCIATNPSDLAVALAAVDAVLQVEGPDGTREVALADFFRAPGDDPSRDNTLARGELITTVDLPAVPAARRSTYRKVRDRASYAFALVSVAAGVELSDGAATDVRIALGGVGTVPWRARVAEDALRGHPITAESARAAARAELAAADPLPDNEFKVGLAENLITSILLELTGQTEVTDR